MLMRDALLFLKFVWKKTFSRYPVDVVERRLAVDRRNVDARRFTSTRYLVDVDERQLAVDRRNVDVRRFVISEICMEEDFL
ncbi:hypothetical protein CDAR_223171, partial [Caerostris darwini]